MNPKSFNAWLGLYVSLVTVLLVSQTGCGPSYLQLRREGQRAMLNKQYGAARVLLLQADEKKRRDLQNLHDLGTCSVMLAKERFDQMNHAAAMREVDAAIAYFSRAIDAHPGHQASLEGKRIALKLKGQFDEALQQAEWAAEFVGPSAKQYVLLAAELEERGEFDEALVRYRQAVAVEPRNAAAHKAFARFLLAHENEEAAVFHLRESYKADPGDPWVVQELAKRRAIPALTAKREGP